MRRSFQNNLPEALKVLDVAFVSHNLGDLCLDVGMLDEAALHLEIALQIHQCCHNKKNQDRSWSTVVEPFLIRIVCKLLYPTAPLITLLE
jgi:hypothetical protein